MAGVHYVVYLPPRADLPFLAVMFVPDGQCHVLPFDTLAEAEAFNMKMAREQAAIDPGKTA